MLKKFGRMYLAAAMATGIACAASAGGVTDTEIVVGTHLDLSGPVAAAMPPLRNGMQMRLDEANEAGGVNGRKFRLVVEDNAGQPQMAVRVVDKLIRQDDVFAILNPFGSGANAAVVKRSVDAGVIYFAPWAASAVIQKIAGHSPLLFTVSPNYDVTTKIGLTWMIDTYGAKKVGFIYQEGPLGGLVADGVKQAMAAKNMSLAAEAAYKVGDIDFSSQVARMKAAGVDLIMLATLTRETIGVMAEVRKLGWTNVKVLTSYVGHTTDVPNLGKDTVNGLYGIGSYNSLYTAENAPDAVKPWFAAYKKRFNAAAEGNALVSYDYTNMFVEAVRAAGRDLTTEKVVKYLQTHSFNDPVFYATQSFKGNHLEPEYVQVDLVKDGVWTRLSKTLK